MRLILLVLPLLAPACPAFVIFDPPQKLMPPVTYSCDDSIAAIAAQAFGTWDQAWAGSCSPRAWIEAKRRK